MIFQRKIVVSVVVALCALMVCSAVAIAADDVITLKLGTHLPEAHGNYKQAIKFAELLSQKTNGKVKIELYPNGQLGGQKELVDGMRMGTVDLSITDVSMLSNYDKAVAYVDFPYVFDSVEHARKALDGKAGDVMKARILKASGIRPLSMMAVAFRNTILSEKEIKSIEDMKGLKVRTPQAPGIIATFKALGATPVPIPSGEAYTAIQTKVVDGMEGNAEYLTLIKIPEVAKKWYETHHNLTTTEINISEKVFKKLPADVQEKMTEAASQALEYYYAEILPNIEENSRKALDEYGVKVTVLDLAPFKAAVKPMIDDFVKKYDAGDIVEAIESVR